MRMLLSRVILSLLPLYAGAANAQQSIKDDSLRVLLGAQSALRTFENRWRVEIVSQVPVPGHTQFANCEQSIRTDWCYGPRNGRVGYTWFGTIPNAARFAQDILPGQVRKKARKLLDDLLANLKTARNSISADRWIAGQLVRVNLERGDPRKALDEAMDCTSERWWCFALQAHVLHMIGNLEEWADSRWTETLYHSMSLEERCRWLDPTDVIRSDSLRRAVAAMDCAQRVDFSERLWWLSDPLYLTRGNERRSEHLSRQVALLLDAFSIQRLDSARVDMIVRGLRQIRAEDEMANGTGSALPPRDLPDITRSRAFAPSPLGYDELVHRLGVPGYFQSTRPETGTLPRIVALFPNPRYSFVPAASALIDPTNASSNEWQLDDDEPYEFQASPDREFLNLDYQVAFFRTHDSARMVLASDMEGHAQLTRRGASAALFVRSDPTRPGAMKSKNIRSNLYIEAVNIPIERTCVSLEVLSRDSSWAGRVRFGAGLPAMPAQRVTLSDVMFVERRSRPPANLDDAEPLILGSTRIKRGTAVGIFWEMYGLANGDSGSFFIKVVRDGPGVLGRVSRAIRGLPPQDQLSIEAAPLPFIGGAPAGSHAVNLDLKTLPPGRYTLAVEVRVQGQQPVETVRTFEILDQ